MSIDDGYPVRANAMETKEHNVRLLGTGAAAPTLEAPDFPGITVTRNGVGDYRLTWADDPGTFLNSSYMLGAATPGDVAGHTLIRDTYASKVMDVILYNASDAAHDLAANEYIDLCIRFQVSTPS